MHLSHHHSKGVPKDAKGVVRIVNRTHRLSVDFKVSHLVQVRPISGKEKCEKVSKGPRGKGQGTGISG